LSNLNVGSLTANLPSASALAGQLQGRALSAAGQLQGQITGQAQALIGQAQGQFDLLRAQGDKLVAAVQQAPGFANTVDRASIDVATTKYLVVPRYPHQVLVLLWLNQNPCWPLQILVKPRAY
jgi:hypothetical protein